MKTQWAFEATELDLTLVSAPNHGTTSGWGARITPSDCTVASLSVALSEDTAIKALEDSIAETRIMQNINQGYACNIFGGESFLVFV